MSSISFSGSVSRPDFSTLRKQFDTRIDADVTSGKISSDDATAIKSAEDGLSKLFDSTSSASTPSSSSFDPSQLKTKVNSFIDGEVKSGKLTSAQADELKSVLQKGAPGGPGGADGPKGGGHGGPGGAGGAHKKSNALDALLQNDDDDDDSDSTTTDTTSSSSDVTKLLDELIKKLQSGTGTDKSQKAQPQFVDYVA